MSDSRLSFQLHPEFVDDFMGKQPNWGPVGYVTYKRTYARRISTLYTRHRFIAAVGGLTDTEEFWLTLLRVVEGTFSIQKNHCKALRLPWDEKKAQDMAQEMYRRIWEFKWLPPGRGLWLMGTPVIEKLGAAGLNNCAFVSTADMVNDPASPFAFLMDMSMLGVGVGSDTRGAGTVTVVEPVVDDSDQHVVDDSREGWVALLRRVVGAYFKGGTTLPESIDYSQVRPAGAPIKGFGGTASGPAPLKEMVEGIQAVLTSRIGDKITSSDIVDIHNLIGRCVVAGNTRRSAEIMFGDPGDEGFLELKDPSKHADKLARYRWASNNSIFATVGQSYRKVARLTAKNGEPGYMWLDNARGFGRMGQTRDWVDAKAAGGNPCLEQTLESYELCCLVETFPAHHATAADYQATLRHAYLYAKTVTLLSTHDERTNAVLMRNRRIGCSMSGVVQAQKKFGRRKFFDLCDSGYQFLRYLDAKYSDWLCVPKSIKITSVKPSGTVSLLCGATPGVHFPHAEHYFRVIRFSSDSLILAKLKDAGYTTFDLDPNEPNTSCVYFPVKEENFDRAEDEVSAWEQLENAAQMQQYWADNQVSVTIKFDPDRDGKDLCSMLELYETRLKGVSFLPHTGHNYSHAPYQKISKEEYEEAVKGLKEYSLDSGPEVQDRFCDGGACELPVRTNDDAS